MPEQSKEIALRNPDQPLEVTPEHIKVIKASIFPNATDPELAIFIHNCQRVGVHPLDKRIIPVKFKSSDGPDKLAFITTIDLLRSKAETSGQYDGQDEPEYGEMKKLGDSEYPEFVKVKVYRKGIPRPFVGLAYWKEYYPGEGGKGMTWRKYPRTMLTKAAEAQALRRAFPDLLHGLHEDSEMQKVSEAGEAPASFEDAVVEAETVEVKPEEPKALEAPQLTVHQELMAMVLRYNGMRMDLIKQCVPQIAPEGKLLSDLSDDEAKAALAKILKMNERVEMPEYCTQTPDKCSIAMIEEGEYKCTGAKDGKKKVKLPCAFGIGMKA